MKDNRIIVFVGALVLFSVSFFVLDLALQSWQGLDFFAPAADSAGH